MPLVRVGYRCFRKVDSPNMGRLHRQRGSLVTFG